MFVVKRQEHVNMLVTHLADKKSTFLVQKEDLLATDISTFPDC